MAGLHVSSARTTSGYIGKSCAWTCRRRARYLPHEGASKESPMNTAAPMRHDQIVALLNGLLETCRDGEFGFGACARHVGSAELREGFAMRAADCQRAALELGTYIAEYGGTPDSGGSAAGALHRGWVEVISALPGGNDHAMLQECQRGEDAAFGRYRDALDQALPEALRVVIERQFAGVQRNREQIQELRERYPG